MGKKVIKGTWSVGVPGQWALVQLKQEWCLCRASRRTRIRSLLRISHPQADPSCRTQRNLLALQVQKNTASWPESCSRTISFRAILSIPSIPETPFLLIPDPEPLVSVFSCYRFQNNLVRTSSSAAIFSRSYFSKCLALTRRNVWIVPCSLI